MKGASLIVAALVLLGGGLWFVLVASEPDERVRELEADSTRMHAELVVIRDSIRWYQAEVAETRARLAMTCSMLPFRSYAECEYIVDLRRQRRRR